MRFQNADRLLHNMMLGEVSVVSLCFPNTIRFMIISDVRHCRVSCPVHP